MTNSSSQDLAAASSSSKNGSCFSSVFRRLLCAGGLPTHPSDNPNDEENYSTAVKLPPPPSPTPTATTPAGIVARLMGIDSFPINKSQKLASLMRKSRSVGSLEYFLPNFPTHTTTHHPHNNIMHTPHHRRVTTSVSFREISPPTTFFFYDHTGNKSDHIRNLTPIHEEKSNHLRKPDMGLTPIQEKSNTLRGRVHKDHVNNCSNKKKKKNSQSQSQRVKVPIKNNEQAEIQVSSSVALKKMRRKKGVDAANAKKKKKLLVIDDDVFPDEQQLIYKSRNTRYNHPLPNMVKHEKKNKKKKKSILLKRRSESSHVEYSQEYCMKALVEVCSLTMAEINEGNHAWMANTKLMGVNNNLQETSYQIAQHILYVLIYDMVDELCSSN